MKSEKEEAKKEVSEAKSVVASANKENEEDNVAPTPARSVKSNASRPKTDLARESQSALAPKNNVPQSAKSGSRHSHQSNQQNEVPALSEAGLQKLE